MNTIRADMVRLASRIAVEHGPDAFQMPKRDAAIHEAGHAVLFEAEGMRVRTVRIFPRIHRGQRYWGGRTSAGSPWRICLGTPVPVIHRQIRFDLAGVLAEVITLGDDFRPGSSLDEVARARQLSAMAAIGQIGARAPDVYVEQGLRAVATLLEHRVVLLELAAALEAEEWLRGRRLSNLLVPLRETVH